MTTNTTTREDGTAAETCQWFAHCTRPATSLMDHPILGSVPICDQCREYVNAHR